MAERDFFHRSSGHITEPARRGKTGVFQGLEKWLKYFPNLGKSTTSRSDFSQPGEPLRGRLTFDLLKQRF
jgi:hypothetical protein